MIKRFSGLRLLDLLLFVALIGGLGGTLVAAQEVSSVAVITTGTGNPELADLLSRSAEVELGRLRFGLTQDAEGASHHLSLTYHTQGGSVDLEAELSDADDDALLAERSAEAKIDLNLDDAVGVLVRELLEEAGIHASAGGAESADGEPSGGGIQATAGETGIGVEPVGVIAVPRDPFFQVNSGFAPFLPLGEVARYAGAGYSPVLSLRRTWVPGRIEVSGGILTGGHNLSMTGAVTEGTSWFIPVGASFWVSSPTVGQLMAAHLFVSAGGAVSILTPAAGDLQRSILPFVFGGLGVTLPVNARFGFSMETGYMTFFDGAFPISGFLPTALVYYRL